MISKVHSNIKTTVSRLENSRCSNHTSNDVRPKFPRAKHSIHTSSDAPPKIPDDKGNRLRRQCLPPFVGSILITRDFLTASHTNKA